MYTYLAELELCHSWNDVCPADDTYKHHLELLIDCITETYSDVTQHLASLLQSGLITYDLLWALFKSNALVCTTCSGTHKPRGVRYNFGEEKTSKSGTKFWNLDCRYLDFNGEDFGSVSIELQIPKFRGTRRINTLEAFPLQYHTDVRATRAELLASGQKFRSLLDEADVFLERRSSRDMVRNGLVSVFLRKLEYCEGIIFLTTNRVSQFDDAILSRIHLMLRYDELNRDARRQIWRHFLNRSQASGEEVDIGSKELERLACSKINGRQVRFTA